MEILLVRHGQPEWVRDGRNVVDPPLTDLGHRQALAMAERLAGDAFDEVFVSPLRRARQTAEPLFDRLARPEQIAPWLEEIRDPNWHGEPHEMAVQAYRELNGRPVADRWQGLVGGESIRDFTDRIHAGATRFLADRGIVRQRGEHGLPVWTIDEPDRRIVLVAHVGTNSITLGHLLGLEPTPWEWDRFVMGHASISRVEAVPVHDGHTFCLTSLSNMEHIDEIDRTR
jgi:broad specificity phosphatase PhoE